MGKVSPMPGAVYDDPSGSAVVRNTFGIWERNVPRYDLSREDVATLGPGFRILWSATAARELDEALPEMAIPDGPVGWGTAWAHWGDTIACMSNAKRMLDAKGQAQCDFIYTGPDAAIPEFLEAQPWIGRVIRGRGPVKDNQEETNRYLRAYSEAAYEDAAPICYLPLIMTDEFPLFRDITPTQPSLHRTIIYRCRPLKGATLPLARREWAARYWANHVRSIAGDGPVIMVHPMSVWSESAHNHWPHTRWAIDWLLAHTPYTYLLTGMEQVENRHPRLINAIGETPSCMEVFALADMCDGVISTCNSVAHWTITQDIPGLIFGNKVMDDIGYYFRRHVDREPNTWINCGDPFTSFMEKAEPWIAEREFEWRARRVAKRMRGDEATGLYGRDGLHGRTPCMAAN